MLIQTLSQGRIPYFPHEMLPRNAAALRIYVSSPKPQSLMHILTSVLPTLPDVSPVLKIPNLSNLNPCLWILAKCLDTIKHPKNIPHVQPLFLKEILLKNVHQSIFNGRGEWIHMKERAGGSMKGLLKARNFYFILKSHLILTFYFIMHSYLYYYGSVANYLPSGKIGLTLLKCNIPKLELGSSGAWMQPHDSFSHPISQSGPIVQSCGHPQLDLEVLFFHP